MKQTSFLQRMIKSWYSLCLVDRILIIFMGILLLQSVYSLFFYELMQEETKTIDVIIRTTAAAVFGYFISGSFRGSNIQNDKPAQNANGFSLKAQEKEEIQTGYAEEKRNSAVRKRIRQQIIIVSFIGISSLVILIVARNYLLLPASSASTVSQLRDFVSGSVGFLIGHSGSERI